MGITTPAKAARKRAGSDSCDQHDGGEWTVHRMLSGVLSLNHTPEAGFRQSEFWAVLSGTALTTKERGTANIR
jgi:hypothetical protein